MTDEQDKRIAEDLKGVFQAVSQAPIRPDPHLATRVMARRHERKSSTAPGMWKWIVTSAMSAAAAVIFTLMVSHGSHYEAFVNRPFVVKMEVEDLKSARIARAEIHLPDGVYLNLEQYPELKEKRSLALRWTNQDQKEFIPFVLSSTEEGTKTITVSFYDEKNQLVGEKKLDVRLKRKS